MGLTPLSQLVKSTRVKTWWRVRCRLNPGCQFSRTQIHSKHAVLRQQRCALSFFYYFLLVSMDSVTIRFTVVSTCQARDSVACPSHLCHGCGGSEQQSSVSGRQLGLDWAALLFVIQHILIPLPTPQDRVESPPG